MKITVEKADVITKLSKKTNKPYFQQEVVVHKDGERFPKATVVFINQEQPYPPGEYEIDSDKSWSVTDYGFDGRSVSLKPVKAK